VVYRKGAKIAGRGVAWYAVCGSVSIAIALAVAACGDDKGSPTARSNDANPAYLVRGVVLEVSDDALTVHHEAIDDFVGKNGKVTGMDAMVMRFRLAPQARAVGVGEGDKVEIRFEARNAKPRFVIQSLRVLPSEAAIHFRAAAPVNPQ
jgi:Cu/Ag efflux protein CusF